MNADAIAKPITLVAEFLVLSLGSLAGVGAGLWARTELPEQILMVAINRRAG
jgi:hypothetical protein